MRALKLVGCFIRTSLQEEAAYRANFWISLFYSVLNLGSGVLGIVCWAGYLSGWTLPSILARWDKPLRHQRRGLFIGPGRIRWLAWTAKSGATFDFTLLRPVNTQLLVIKSGGCFPGGSQWRWPWWSSVRCWGLSSPPGRWRRSFSHCWQVLILYAFCWPSRPGLWSLGDVHLGLRRLILALTPWVYPPAAAGTEFGDPG